MKTGIQITDTFHWVWFFNHDCPIEFVDNFEGEFEKDYHGTIGKYLFFSENKDELIELASDILSEHNLYNAKVASELRSGYTEYVLCVYDYAPNLTKEMLQHASDTIKYRYWKSDEQTIKGE